MAPEQVAGDSDLDRRADLYAVGVVARGQTAQVSVIAEAAGM